MRPLIAPVLGLVVGLGLLLTGCGTDPERGPTESDTITVFAAASVKSAFEAIAPGFTTAEGIRVSFSFLGSQDLVANLVGGAHADVLATADETSMARAAESGLVADATIFARNTLVLVTPPGNPAGVTGIDASLEGTKLVVCDQRVPCGTATATLAKNLGVTLHPVSQEQKVSDVMSKITTGEGDVGIVYATDAATAGDQVTAVAITGSERVVNKYPIALTAEPTHREGGQKFLDYVLSPAGQKVLADHGFLGP